MDFIPFYRRPGFRTVLGVAVWVAAIYASFRLAAPARPALALLFDFGLFGLSLLLVIALVSQFVLPVRAWSDRAAVVQRLLDYALGTRGPVLFLRNGQTVESKGERSRRGPGVLLADYASAGVLRTETRFTRAVGPGVTFTEPGERLAAALDLRRQVRTVEGQPPAAGETHSAGRPETLALTEDGIPVSVDLRVTFMLDPGHASTPRHGQFPHLPPFEFNARAAERAVYGHAHRADQPVQWTELPLLVAIDIWREEAKEWPLDALLSSGGARPTPLDRIQSAMEQKLVAGADGLAHRREAPPPREREVLRRRGIRVLSVEVDNVRVPAAVREEHLRRWRLQWSGELEEDVLAARGRGQEARWAGEQQGLHEMLRAVTSGLRAELAEGRHPNKRDTLLHLLEDAIQFLQKPELLPESGALVDHLRQVAAEVRGLDSDCRKAGDA
jgi:regulator of protease activity HflC (stomatin/prohibitin superfamily)